MVVVKNILYIFCVKEDDDIKLDDVVNDVSWYEYIWFFVHLPDFQLNFNEGISFNIGK